VWARGTTEFERVVLLTDAVVAIAATILVLELRVPSGVAPDALESHVADDWRSFLAFGLSFALIALSWAGHHRFVGTIDRMDGRFVAWNFTYLALVCLMPYASSLISTYANSTFAVVLYLGIVGALTVVGMIGTILAVQCGFTREPGYTPGVRFDLIDDAARIVVFLIGIGIALVATDPSWGLTWLAVYLPVGVFVGRFDPDRAARRAARARRP
jgi:uncharacterized membrane protein